MTTHTQVPVARAALVATDVAKVYGSGDTRVQALDGVTVAFASGQFTAIMGASGSGKSTLLHCIAGLDTVTSGSVRLYHGDGRDTELASLGDRALTLLRRQRFGFVFQSFNLLPALTAEQNIRLPLDLAGVRPDPQWWKTVVDALGLADRLRHRPSQLSGGQRQRVASARAFLARPEVIFADEPTGNLDSAAGQDLLGLLRRGVSELGQTVVMVTHDPGAAAFADRVVFLSDGRIAGDISDPTQDTVLDHLRKLGS